MLLRKSFWRIWVDNVWVATQICVVITVGFAFLFGPALLIEVYHLPNWSLFPLYGLSVVFGGSFIIAVLDYNSRKKGM